MQENHPGVDADIYAEMLQTLHRFVRERLVPLEDEVEQNNALPDGLIDELRELGLFGLSIPEEYGGLGLSTAQECGVAMEFGYTSPCFRSAFGTNVGIGSQAILIDGTPEQKAAYLPKMATGELIGSFALTEPDVGSDAASVKTTATREGDTYILNGTKRFITNAPRAGVFTVMARTGTAVDRAKGVSAFLVDAKSPGLSLGTPERKMGQKGAPVCDVIFEDVRVPADALIGGVEGMGFKTAMKVLDRGRLHISAFCVGAMQRAIDEAGRYAVTRKQFDQKLAEFQLIQAMLADSQMEYVAARALVSDKARAFDDGTYQPSDSACCKLFATEALGRIVDRAVQIHGGSGYIADYPVERLYRDARLFRLYEGTSQIQQLVIARDLVRRYEQDVA